MSGSDLGNADCWRVALVDDDEAVLRAMARLLSVHGHEVLTYNSAFAFLNALGDRYPDVLLLDLRMPGLDGIGLQEELLERGIRIPTVFLSGHADVTSSVRALRNGAIDFLEKPCDERTLLDALGRAASLERLQRRRTLALRDAAQNVQTLTPREREVFRLVADGRLNKQIAALLGTAEKTVKVHRARVMAKMHAESVAELVRVYDLLAETGATGGRKSGLSVSDDHGGRDDGRSVGPDSR